MMCDPPPAMGDDGGHLVFEGAKLKLIVPTPGAGVVRLSGDQVTARDQFVALDGGVDDLDDGHTLLYNSFGNSFSKDYDFI